MVRGVKFLQKIIPVKNTSDPSGQVKIVDFSNVDKLEIDENIDYIGSKIIALGNLVGVKEVVIAGEMIGNIETEELSLLEGGLARCNITANNVNIAGKFVGQIKAKEQISISASAIVKAMMEFEQLAVESGAILKILGETNDLESKEIS